jgi:putative membrane protein
MISSSITSAFVMLLDEPRSLWSVEWSWEPSILLSLLILLVWYVAGAVRRGSIDSLRWRHAAFLFGWTTLFFALTSPIHELGEHLFSAHMLQHEILILVSAPLIAASHPGATLLWAFAPRHRLGIGTWVHRVEASAPVLVFTSPTAAWMAEACALWGWHIPYLYQATLYSDWVHASQHLTFLTTAVVFWSALFGVGRPAFSYGAGTLYVFATAIHCSALGALLTFSTVLWYPAYERTTIAWGLTPLQDQQLGGVIMWVPSALAFITVGLTLFARWIKEAERRAAMGKLNALLQQQERQ